MRRILALFSVLLFGILSANAQTRSLTGKISDATGKPVENASILLKGTTKGTTSDGAGSFIISVKSGDVLTISAVSFESQEIKIANQTDLSISLAPSSANLSEVVVTTALGIRRQAKELGYAATTIGNKTLTQAKSVNIQQSLNGKISGLNVSTVNSGVFENAKINIRGIRSLTGNNQPMLVVDGAPTPLGYLASIPPDDVQSLTVLKSAASAAIYGPDAVNGVIVVTTKRGAKKPTVTFNSSVQTTAVSFFPKLQKEFGAGAGETVDQYGNYEYVPYENQQYGPRFDGTLKPIGVPVEDGSIQTVPYSNGHYSDKVKFWNTGFTLQNSISVSGEDFYVSVNDAKINGLIPGDELRRTSFRFNGGKKYGKLAINYGINYTLQNYDVMNEAGISTSFPDAYNGGLFFAVMQTPSNVPLLDYKDWRNSKWAQNDNYYNEYAINPYWLLDNVRSKGREDDIIGNLDVSYEIAPWLKANARVSTNLAFASYDNTNAPVVIGEWAAANRNATQFSNRSGATFSDATTTSRINLDYYLSGEKDLSKDFSIKYILGSTVRENKFKETSVGGNNLVIPYLYNVSVRSGDAAVGANGRTQSRLLAAYGSLAFSYQGWANVEFTGRNDWDSRLSPENRSFFYPAANVSLVLTDAIPSLKNSNALSYLKFFGSISKSGNVNLGTYALKATYFQPTGFPYGTTTGFSASDLLPDENLKPEFVNTKEIGLEMGLLKNRINLNATYFYQKNTNQVLAISESAATGYRSKLANAADFKNYGVEMELGLTPLIKLGKFNIDLSINATYNNNKVLSTAFNSPVIIGGSSGFIQNSVSSPTVNNIAIVGQPAFAFQLSDYLRDSVSGKVIVDPITGMPQLAADMVIKGRSLPLWVVGVTPTISYGNFSLSMTWDYKGGHDFFSGLGSDEDFAGISARSAEYGRERFVFPNSVYLSGGKYVENTNIQVQDGNYNFWATGKTNTQVATNYFSSAAAVRLRELNITYTFPETNWIGANRFVKKISISAIGKNLLLFVPKSNQWGDPEFNYSSTGNTFGVGSSFQSPASRLLGGSLTVQF